MTVIVIVLFCLLVGVSILALVLFNMLSISIRENEDLSIKANATRVIESPDDVFCYMRFADGTIHEVKRKDIAIGGKSNA